MSHLIKPENYHALLDLQQTEIAIKKIKDFFLSSISTELRLRRVTAPLFVLKGLGMNDDLNGVERPVTFPIKDMNEAQAEVVHSLAKWKRVTLAEYQVQPGYGIITDMNAIRADEEMDNLHSLYVDQWDWERVMPPCSRNTDYLKKIVNRIYNAILRTEFHICETYPQLQAFLPEDVHFIHAEELRRLYPDLSPKEREDAICRKYGAVPFLESKAPVAGKILAALRKYDLIHHAVFSSTEFSHLEEARSIDPNIFLHHIFTTREQLERLAELGNGGVSWNYPDPASAPPERIAETKKHGVRVCLRAADSPERLRIMIDLKLDYIPTNILIPKGGK